MAESSRDLTIRKQCDVVRPRNVAKSTLSSVNGDIRIVDREADIEWAIEDRQNLSLPLTGQQCTFRILIVPLGLTA